MELAEARVLGASAAVPTVRFTVTLSASTPAHTEAAWLNAACATGAVPEMKVRLNTGAAWAGAAAMAAARPNPASPRATMVEGMAAIVPVRRMRS